MALPTHIHTYYLDQITNFTQHMCGDGQSKEYYERRRNAHRAIDNIKIGKYGEFAANYILSSLGLPSISIDCEIRHGKNKQWQCDLPYSDINLDYPNCHVKTCDDHSYNYVGDYSWTFQLSNVNGNGGTDKLFKPEFEQDIVIMIYVTTLQNPVVKLCASSPFYLLKPKMREPIAGHLKGLKACVYYKNL